MAHLFVNDLGEQTAVRDGLQMPVVALDDPALWADTLNWFEGDQLVIGSRDNPAHVAEWRKWNERQGKTNEAHVSPSN